MPKASSTRAGWRSCGSRSCCWIVAARVVSPRWRPAAAQRGDDLRLGQPRRPGRGGGNGQHRAGFGCGDSAGALGEGVQETREVLPQQRPQFVAGPGAPPGGVLMRPGQHGDRLRQFGVGGQPAMLVGVGTQDVGQRDGITMVGLLARHRVPLPVAGHRHRVDRVDRSTARPQHRDQQAARGLDRDRDRVLGSSPASASMAVSSAKPATDSGMRRLATSRPSASTIAMS